MLKLSIIIPAYNEKNTIEEIIRRIKAVNLVGVEKEIIVVDDGSNDGTRDIIKKISGIRYIFHEKNLGKGGAMKTGFKAATGDLLIPQDADLEYDPNDYSVMIAPILRGEAEVTNGVRIQPPNDSRRTTLSYWLHWFGNSAITWATNWLYWNNAEEYEGCYKAITKKLADSVEVETNNFDYDNELICKILKRGYKIVDVPIRYYPRDYEQGKKISWKHGFLILWTVIKTRFVD
ncbi:MAG: glycosyltransferase family 2 protein [Candidatus Harrisonbacteria bacterium]|nr:glycosyltransferase family 2 protein [Candidatus Harrisonbacteria bacterium]